jgi:hypothetical protein
MAKFIFKIEEYNEAFKRIDEFEEWITADDRLNAWAYINKAYPSSKGFDVTLINIE